MKKWFESKTLWVNFIALVAVVLEGIYGKPIINAETQSVLIVIINMALRILTKDEINWK